LIALPGGTRRGGGEDGLGGVGCEADDGFGCSFIGGVLYFFAGGELLGGRGPFRGSELIFCTGFPGGIFKGGGAGFGVSSGMESNHHRINLSILVNCLTQTATCRHGREQS
jgi:hypothetical protein